MALRLSAKSSTIAESAYTPVCRSELDEDDRSLGNAEVGGSSPPVATIRFSADSGKWEAESDHAAMRLRQRQP